jgi:hypothetical protein
MSPLNKLLKYLLWLRGYAFDSSRRVLLGVVKAGPIPPHVAFIMDKGVKEIQGHVDGFVALRRIRAASSDDCTPTLPSIYIFLFLPPPVTDTGNVLDA